MCDRISFSRFCSHVAIFCQYLLWGDRFSVSMAKLPNFIDPKLLCSHLVRMWISDLQEKCTFLAFFSIFFSGVVVGGNLEGSFSNFVIPVYFAKIVFAVRL